jgi:hypothetical protein
MRLDGGLPVELVDEQGSQIVPAVHQRGALIDRRYSHLARIMFVNGTLFLFSCYRNEINSGITAALSHLSDGIRSNYQQAQPLLCSAAAVVRHSVSQMMRSIQSWMIDSYRQLPQACQTALNSALTTGSVSIAFGGDGMRIEAPNQDYRLLMTPLLFCQRPFLQPQASQNNDDLVLIKQMLEREPYRELFKIKPARLT